MEDWDLDMGGGSASRTGANYSQMNNLSNGGASQFQKSLGLGRGKSYDQSSNSFGSTSHGFDGNGDAGFEDSGFGSKSNGYGGQGGGHGDRQGGRGGGGRFGGSRGGRTDGRSNACFKCGEEGHMSRECPNAGESNRGGGRSGGRGGGSCFKCNQEGHRARDCPSGDDSRSKSNDEGFGARTFGSVLVGGPQSSADDDWDSGTTQGGFGAKSSFGAKSAFGDSAFDGFGSGKMETDSFNDEPKFGGFGGRSGGGGGGRGGDRSGGDKKGCFKCGEEGHFSRECPSADAGGKGSGRGCYKCGEEGHMSRDCPNADASGGGRGGGGGGGSRACFKCGEDGHMSRECPNADASGGRGGGGGGGGSRACFKCGEDGHMSRECPNADASGGRGGGGGGGGGGKGCFKCGEEGHMSRECPNADASGGRGGGGGGGGKGSGCYKCGEEGHMSRDCTNAATTDQSGVKKVPLYIPPPPPEGEEEIFETIAKGINFSRYDEISVEVTGNNAPARSITSFEEADIDEAFKQNVRKAHYDKPTPIQKWAIPVIASGRDLMGCAQTGSGKTAAFLLPVLHGMKQHGIEGSSFSEVQEPQALIVGPTRELVLQIYNEARKFSYGTMIRPVVLYGGVSVNYQLSQVEQGAHMVVGTPGRLLDVIRRKKISLEKVRYFILDEADRMLDLGFKNEMIELSRSFGMPAERQTLMFSATFPEEIQHLAKELLRDYIFITVGRVGGANWDIKQNVFQVGQNDKRDKLVSILNETGNDRTLIFVEQKRQADFLASFLSQSNFPTTSIHGDREQREREEALRDFKTARAPILVATSVAARGLDIANVVHVINYDMPSSIDEYVHRIGRTGRCGNLGKASSFFNPDTDRELGRPLVKVLADAQQTVPTWLEELSESSYGAGGFTSVGGSYGSRDTRKGQFGGSGGDFDSQGGGKGFGGAPHKAVDEEEEWS